MIETDLRWCPACRMRFRVGGRDGMDFGLIEMSHSALLKLRAAAQSFDADADELYTAVEFLAWLEPDISSSPHHKTQQQLAQKPWDEVAADKRRDGVA